LRAIPIGTKFKSSAHEPDGDPIFVTALARGLSVLCCFTRSTPELSVTDIGRMTDLPQPTIWRLCHTLRRLGYLTQALEGKKLRLGIPVLGLGYALLADLDIATLARPHMQALADQFEESVSLATMDGADILFLQRCETPSLIYSGFPVGARSPITRAPAGWAMLAGMDEGKRNSVIAAIEATDPTHWSSMRSHIDAAIIEFEEFGFVTNMGKVQSEFHAVSAPIASPDGKQMFALSCVGLRSRLPAERLYEFGPLLRECTKVIAQALRPG